MTERQPSKEGTGHEHDDDELKLHKETVKDLDPPEGEGDNVRGGREPTRTGTCAAPGGDTC